MNTNQNAKATAGILILLLILAIGGFIACISLALQTNDYFVSQTPGRSYEVIADSGLNGGALGCGIFGAAALVGFVKVFLAKTD